MRPLTQALTIVALATVVVVGWVVLRPGGDAADDPGTVQTDSTGPAPATSTGKPAPAQANGEGGDSERLGGLPAPAPNVPPAEAQHTGGRDAGSVRPARPLPMPLIPPDPAREEKVLWGLRRAIARAADAGTTAESPQLRRLRAIERAMAERMERRRLDAGAGTGERPPP